MLRLSPNTNEEITYKFILADQFLPILNLLSHTDELNTSLIFSQRIQIS